MSEARPTAAEMTRDNPELSRRVQEQYALEEEDKQNAVSIAQRLMRRAHEQIINVSLEDGLDIEVYAPTDSEMIELVKLQSDIYRVGKSMQKQGVDFDSVGTSVDAIADGYDRLNKMLGKLCVDASLSYAFFASGQISAADKGAIIAGIMQTVNANREKVSRFR